MQESKTRRVSLGLILAGTLALIGACALLTGNAAAQSRFEISGFAMLDMGYETGQSHPDWFDTMRPTKLPAYKDEYGKDGRFFSGVRQSRLGVRSFTPTDLGELKTIFEFELFGTGVDAGQTTFRLRHAWGELPKFGAGQTWSTFMDPDVFPNSLEYWGPNGTVWFRNVQARWMPVHNGDTHLWLALERPGASADPGNYSSRIQLQDVQARFPLPDFSAQYRMGQKWGYLQAAGLVRYLKWDDLNPGGEDLSGDATGWGIDISSNIKFAKDVLKLQFVYGEGIENYMNDAPVDVGVKVDNPADPHSPIQGKALPVTGIVAFLDHTWSDKVTSSLGYSRIDIDNSNGQGANAFKTGQYALVNALYYPTAGVMLGPELQWGRRDNNSDGWNVDDVKIQFSFKYNFSHTVGGR
jgi:hypothetical protein